MLLWGIAVFAVMLVPMTVTPLLPVIDFYAHAGRYVLLAQDALGQPIDPAYEIDWSPKPNLAGDILVLPLFMLLPPELASKFAFALVFAIFLGGVVALNVETQRQQRGQADGTVALSHALGAPLLLAALCLYNHVFHWGFFNYLVALGLSLWATLWWVRQRERSLPVAVIGSAVFGTGLFFAHAYAFAMWGVVLAMYELGRAQELARNGKGDDAPRGAFLRNLVSGWGGLALSAVPAVTIFLQLPLVSKNAAPSTLDSIADHIAENSLWQRLWEICIGRLEILLRQLETPYFWLDVAFHLVLWSALFLALYRRWIEIPRRWWPAFIAIGVAYLVTPPTVLGIGFVPDRLPTMAVFLFAAVMLSAPPRRFIAFIGVMALLRVAILAVIWSGSAQVYRDALSWSDRIAPGESVIMIAPNSLAQRWARHRCKPLAVVYLWRAQARVLIFSDPGIHAVRLKEPLSGIAERYTAAGVAAGYFGKGLTPSQMGGSDGTPEKIFERYLDKLAAIGADFALSCNEELFAFSPASRFEQIVSSGPVALYRLE